MKKSYIGKFIVFLLIIMANTGCVSLKNYIYLQGDLTKKISDLRETDPTLKSDYLVKANDVLYITVNSLDERTSAFLNNATGYTQLPESPMSTSLLGYRVNLDGTIDFPFIGKIQVAGNTIPDIREKIQLAVSNYVEQSSVTVKLLNDNITVLGEVRMPGRFVMAGQELNLMEVLSLAGDMTDFANRKRVKLIRKEGDNIKVLLINTLDQSIMFSPYYYLKAGDIVIVEPRRNKARALSSDSMGLTFTFLNTVIMAFTLYVTLTQSN